MCVFLFGIIFDTSAIYGLFSGYYKNIDLILEEEKTLTFYSEVQTEQKHAIWSSCCFLYGQQVRWNSGSL